MKPFTVLYILLLPGCAKQTGNDPGYVVYDTFNNSIVSRSKNFAAIHLTDGEAEIDRRTIYFKHTEEKKDTTNYLTEISKKNDTAYNEIFKDYPPQERTGFFYFTVTFFDVASNNVKAVKVYVFDITNYKPL